MFLDERIEELSKEIFSLRGNMCRQDIIRRMKQLMRETAENCASMIKEDAQWDKTYSDFDDKPHDVQSFSKQMENRILNQFLE